MRTGGYSEALRRRQGLKNQASRVGAVRDGGDLDLGVLVANDVVVRHSRYEIGRARRQRDCAGSRGWQQAYAFWSKPVKWSIDAAVQKVLKGEG